MSEPPSKTEITVVPHNDITIQSMRPEQITHQMNLIRQVMKDNMEEGQDYGVIPGTPKPTLFKAGAEKLRLLFFLSPSFDWREGDLGNGHKEFEFSCTLTQIHTGQVWGQGIGSASTMESKYRYRKGLSGGRIENPDIANEWNTVRKMGKKRAFVDAILTVTSASAIFTQDVEDLDRPQKARDAGTAPAVEQEEAPVERSTTLIVPPDDDGVQTWRSYVKKVVPKSGVGKNGQPWHMVGLFLPGDSGDYWVSTFDKNLGKRATSFQGKECDITVRRGQKEGSWDLLNISVPGISRQVETALKLEREKEANGEQELELEEVEANPFNDQD